jgi:hypothetical protein
MTYWEEDWEARVAREEATEAADEWVTREGMRVNAAAGLTGPWGPLHPVAWGYATGRLTAADVSPWRQRFDADPGGVAAVIAQCVPALGPQGPQHIRAAAGITAAGVVSQVPDTAASPPGPRPASNAVEELRATHPGLVDAATRDGGPPPSLFVEGDTPRITASGIDPAALRGLPWRAKLAAAWEPNRLDAFRITQDYGGPDGDTMSRVDLAGHPAVTRHVSEVNTWAATMPEPAAPTPEEVATLYPKPTA